MNGKRAAGQIGVWLRPKRLTLYWVGGGAVSIGQNDRRD
jgi:hypothetical protein